MNIESFFQEVQDILATKIKDDDYRDKILLSAEDENIQAIVNQYYNKDKTDTRTCARHLYKILKNSVGIKKSPIIKTFEEFTLLLESNKNKTKSGKNSFNIFLDCIDKSENIFNSSNHLNTGDFYYFFLTDTFNNDAKLRNIFENKKSIPKAFGILEKLKKEKKDRLVFYFGIDKDSFEYGIFDLSDDDMYIVGDFKFDDNSEIVFKNKCLSPIKNKLNSINTVNIKLLKEIKNKFNDFIKDVKITPVIKDENTLIWEYKNDVFRKEDITEDKMNIFINSWIYKNNLNKKISGFVTLKGDSVIFNLKPKNITSIIIE